MKKIVLPFLILILASFSLYAQDFLGISTGNYAGVTGVMLQPASIVDSRYKFEINLFSTGVRYNNNYFLVDRDVILKFKKNNFSDYQSFKANYLSEANLPAGEKAFFNINNRTQLPLSFMVNISKKSAIALNFQSRSMVQGRNISQDLAKMAYNGFFYAPLNDRPFDASGITINSLNWVETGLTYGRVLYNNDKHFLKAAFTAKYLAGIASLSVGSDDFRLGVNSDSSINFNSSNFRYNHSEKADFDMVFDKKFRPDANAFGFDAGLVYEYRGNLDHFKYIKNDDEKSYEADRRDVNKYIFKLGASLLDAGMFTFDKPANVNSFSADVNNWNIGNANYNTIREFDTALANRVVKIAGDPRQYNVYLPAALSLQLDIRFVKGLYLNAMAYRPLKMGTSNGNRFDNYGYYTITPRWERRHFGIYIPYTIVDRNNISSYKDNRLGATVRIGSFFIGSSNLGNMAFNKNLKAADVHLGLKVGFTHGKPTMASRLFDKKSKNNIASAGLTPGVQMRKVSDTVTLAAPLKSDLLVDYTKGQVYSGVNPTGNIIIINNNHYYGTNAAVAKDTPFVQQNYRITRSDTVYLVQDSLKIISLRERLKADSTLKIRIDSIHQKRTQLDSLINRLQLLRLEMDSIELKENAAAFNEQKAKDIKDQHALLTEQKDKPVVTTVPIFEDTLRSDSLKYVLQGAVDTEKVVNPISLADKDIKKKRPGVNDSLKKVTSNKINPLTKETDTRPQPTIIQNETRVREIQNRQGQAYQRYFQESEKLESEIRNLEKSLKEERRARVNTIPAESFAVSPVAGSLKDSGISTRKKDTIYIRDTIQIADTVRIHTSDTLVEKRDATPITVYVPVEKEKIIKERPDYTKMPAEIVLFDIGKAAIRPSYNNKLNYIAEILVKNPGLKARITGHTDKTGSAKVNELLSLKRANTVKTFLSEKGVDEGRLQVDALSNSAPVVKGNSNSANSQNRRVVVKIINN